MRGPRGCLFSSGRFASDAVVFAGKIAKSSDAGRTISDADIMLGAKSGRRSIRHPEGIISQTPCADDRPLRFGIWWPAHLPQPAGCPARRTALKWRPLLAHATAFMGVLAHANHRRQPDQPVL